MKQSVSVARNFLWVVLAIVIVLLRPTPARSQTTNGLAYWSSGEDITIYAYLGSAHLAGIPGTIDGLPVTSIEMYAFAGSPTLTSVSIPASVTSVGSGAFDMCPQLTNITVSSDNCYYSSRKGVLFDKAQTTLFKYPESKPGPYAVPSSVTTIDSYAFFECSKLTRITIPEGVTAIYWSAFGRCPKLTKISASEANPYYSTLDGVLFDKQGTKLIQFPVGKGGEYIIPGSVKSIEENAFAGSGNLSKITVPDSVTEVGGSAFALCTNLTNVVIGNSVTNLVFGAFQECRNLSHIRLPGSLRTLGSAAFAGCSSLTDVEFGQGIVSLGEWAFQDCTSLHEITIPGSISRIGYMTFAGCTNLADVDLGTGVQQVGTQAFESCNNLLHIDIPDTVNRIEPWAFSKCSNLVKIRMPAYLSKIETGTFADCAALPNLTIPINVTAIEDHAFANCSSLTNIVLPTGLAQIGAYAFDGCRSLRTFHIPDSLTSIDMFAFSGCSALTSIGIHDASTLSLGAFANCVNLTNVWIGAAVTNIFSPFFGCDNLINLLVDSANPALSSFNGTLFNKDQNTILSPTSLAGDFSIPEGVTNIVDWTFFGCTLTRISIPSSVLEITLNAFAYCSNLTEIDVAPRNPLFCSRDGVLYDKSEKNLLRFPMGKVGHFEIPEGVTNVAERAFYLCFGLSSLRIPKSVTTIASSSFELCTGLTNVVLGSDSEPDSPVTIGRDAFKDCRNLIYISLPSSITELGDGAFQNCARLNNVTLPPNLSAINSSTFEGCESLSQFSMPKGIESIGGNAFLNCLNLTNVTIPDGVAIIPWQAFAGCTSLTTISIPASVTELGEYAFAGCSNLSRIYFDGLPPYVAENVFACSPNVRVYYYRHIPWWGNIFAGKSTFPIDARAPISIQIVGKGSLLGITNGQTLVIGSTNVITAKPAHGFALWSWTSNLFPDQYYDPRLTFVMQPDLNIQAWFYDVEPPSLNITWPKKKDVVSCPTVTVTGTVSDNGLLWRVWVRLGDQNWTQALILPDKKSWFVPINATTGTNTVSAYAIDDEYNYSPEISASFVYIPSDHLNVSVNGRGTLSPNYSNSLLQIGKAYSITAKPAPGFVFSNWTGLDGQVLAAAPTLHFTMASNLNLTANFIPNPWISISGNYFGLLTNIQSAELPGSAFFTATLRKNGTVSGSILQGAKKHSFTGHFSVDGSMLATFANHTSLSLTLDLAQAVITGTFSTPDWTSSLTSCRAGYSKTNQAPHAGIYTLITSPVGDPELEPGGYGIGNVIIDPAGNVTLTATLGDGTKLTSSSAISIQRPRDSGTRIFAQSCCGDHSYDMPLPGRVAKDFSPWCSCCIWFRSIASKNLPYSRR